MLRDHLWLWCHVAGSHTRTREQHGIPGHSTITPAEAAKYLGIPNALMVRYELAPRPPFEPHAAPLASMKQVVWSIEGGGSSGEVHEVLALPSTLPSLQGVILDDYFAKVTATARMGIATEATAAPAPAFSLEAIKDLRQQLKVEGRPLEIWVVLYAHELGLDAILRPHLELCDVVTMWTRNAAELMNLERQFERFEQVAGEKRKLLGVYMWDYGDKQPMPLTAMEQQCTLGKRWLHEGRIDGMIFLASCICDLGLEAVEWVRRWIVQHAEEPV